MTGIPTELTNENGDVLNNPETIIEHVITFVANDINDGDYKLVKVFQPREGHTQHSAKLVFTSDESKKGVMLGSKELNKLENNNTIRKVFIKNLHFLEKKMIEYIRSCRNYKKTPW